MSILASRRRRVEFVDDLRSFHADIAPQPDTSPAPVRRQLHHEPDVRKPATSRTVLDELRAEDSPAAQIRSALTMAVAPLLAALGEPAPATDWLHVLNGVENSTMRALSGIATDATRALNFAWNNVQYVRAATAAILDSVAGVERYMVDAVATWISEAVAS